MMNKLLQWLNAHALTVAIIVGALGYGVFRIGKPLLPPLIFMMLFFTFCKVNPLDLRLHKWHWIALACQLLLAVSSYFLTLKIGKIWHGNDEALRVIGQSVMLCFIMPTATAAPIIAGKLGGSIQNLTTFTLLSNFATAIVVPLFFPIVNPMADMSFFQAFLIILRKVGPLLMGPFVAAWFLRLVYEAYWRQKGEPKVFALNRKWAQLPFYIWTCTIIILTGDMTDTLVHGEYSWWTLVLILAIACITCALQFVLGWYIGQVRPATSHGTDYQDVVVNPATAPTTPSGISRVTAGQALGQKNTTLAIWMAQTYLMPLVGLAPALYMIVQNFFNSWQLSQAAKGIKR